MIRLRATLRPLRSLALRLPDDAPELSIPELETINARLLPALIGRPGWDPRTRALTSIATLTPDLDVEDLLAVTAQAAPLTIVNPVGTFANGRKMMLRLRDNGTARALTFGAAYFGLAAPLPASTVAGKTSYLGFFYNDSAARFELVAYAIEI